MSFLSPWFLLGLLGVGIPLAIHMIRREKSKPMVFSTIRFLKKVPQKRVLFQQLQQRLLLLLRIVMVALLVLAFARPFLTDSLSEAIGTSPQSVVILLDTSMSMQYGDSFDQAKAATQEVIQSLHAGDEAALITFTKGIEHIQELTTDLSKLETFLHNLPAPGYQSTQYFSALRFADEILQTAHYPNRKIVLISDYQQHAFESFDLSWQLSPGVVLENIFVGNEETTNLAVTDVKVSPTLKENANERVFWARISNRGTRHVSEAQTFLSIDGHIVAQQTIDLKDKSEAVVEFLFSIDPQQSHRVSVSVEDESFPPDNTFFLTVDIAQPVKILTIHHDTGKDWYQDKSYWLRLAVSSHTSDSSLEVIQKSIIPDQLMPYDVLVLFDAELSQRDVKKIHTFIKGGKSLLLVPTNQVAPRRFNTLFEQLSPAALEQQQVFSRDNFLRITDVQDRHPIFHALRVNQIDDFSAARFWEYWSLLPQADSEILMNLSNGEPMLLEKKVGSGRVMLLASSLDTKGNNLPVQIVFLPLMHEMFAYLSFQEEKKQAYSIEEAIPVFAPTGTLVQVTPSHGQKNEQAFLVEQHPFYTATHFPGFYQVRNKNQQAHFAVNVPVEESDFTLISPAEIHDSVVNPAMSEAAVSKTRVVLQEVQLEQSQQFWWTLLLMVLVLGLGETLLANRTYR